MSYEKILAENLSKNIIYLRRSRSLTQDRLSKLAGIPRSTVTNLESGSSNPSLGNLVRIAAALETKVEDLLAPPISQAKLVKQDEFSYKNKNGNLVYNLLPSPIKGLILEKLELLPNNGFTGIPHLKGTKEYFTCIQGKARVTVVGKTFDVSKGDVLVFKGNEAHSYHNVHSTKALAISIIVKEK